ncbi:hypothetical protein [uncultured Microbacterium sp.]|uniref:hypothetical protein n=1 Tax=uncultured Microbacterium sp. TaxID=191216 RepID=UPI0028EC6984|nr:hypothetical protein [uncultured Microbacterium sp.]
MTSTTQLALDIARIVPASLDQAETAMRILADWADGDTTDIDEGIARLLAATMQDGPGTALHQFASTGELAADNALAELGDCQVPLEREAWVDALGRYIINGGARS